jgi:hypothetical protein
MPMLGYVLAACWFGFAVVYLIQLRRPLAKKTKTLLLVAVLAMFAMTVVQVNATREHASTETEIASIKLELDRIEQEGQSGHRPSAKELQARNERLQELRVRLDALGRRPSR